jgi:hypothetical protein
MLANRLAKRGGASSCFRFTEFLPAVQERLNKQRKTDWKNRAQFFAVIYRIVGYLVSDTQLQAQQPAAPNLSNLPWMGAILALLITFNLLCNPLYPLRCCAQMTAALF